MDVPSPIRPEALLAEAGLVRRLAQALVRRSDLAHDVAQEVLLVALRQPQPPAHLRGWLAAVTRRLAGKALRSQRVRERAEAAAALEPFGDGEARTAERLLLHRRLTDAVLALPEPYRTAVTLRFLDELPPRAIAQRLGTSSEVVRKRLQRGLEMLRERLDAEFGDRGRWALACAGLGLLEAGSPWLLLSVLAMNKLALAAAATLVVGVFVFWPEAEPPPVVQSRVAAGDVAAVSAAVEAGADDVAPPQRESRSASSPPTPACVVRIVDDAGRPIVGADVFGWRDTDVDAVHRVSDRDGRCAFGAWRGAGGLLVAADGRFLHHEGLVELAGEHELVLPSGATIAGTLLVDGQPGAGWRMSFAAPVPERLQDRLSRRYGWRSCEAVCDAFGRFEFVGVPADWSGTLSLPQPLWLLEQQGRDDASLEVRAGQRDLYLLATQLPTLRGRAFWSDTGEPVAWPRGMAAAEFDDGSRSPDMGFRGQRDGTFAIGFHDSRPSRRDRWLEPERRPSVKGVQLAVADQSGAAAAKLLFDAEQFVAAGELSVRLDRVPITWFRCIDMDGRAIAGARLQAHHTSDKTDADGRGTFAGTPDEVRLVGSPHHRIGPVVPRAPAAGTSDDPLVFVLEPSNVVRVRVDDAGSGRRQLRLRSDVPMFAGRRQHDNLDESLHGVAFGVSRGARGRRQADGSTEWHDFHLTMTTDERGEAELWSLEPGIVSEFWLLDDFSRPLATAEFRAPAPGDELEVVLSPPAATAPFVGRVVDPDGQPLDRVEVAFRSEAGEEVHHAYSRTDAEGRFELRCPGDLSRATMNLRLDGYVEQRHERLVTGAAPQVWVLQRGRSLTVQVVDEHDQPLDLVPVWDHDHFEEKRDWVREGVWRWRDLPIEPVTISCQVGEDRFRIVAEPGTTAATLRVPRPAKLRVDVLGGWPKLADARHAMIVVARCVDGGHATCRLWHPERGEVEALLPGIWLLELIEWSQPERSLPGVEWSLGRSAEVTLRAGEEVTATLR